MVKFLLRLFLFILVFNPAFAGSVDDKIKQARENFKTAFTNGNFRDAEKFAKQSLNLGKKKYGPHSPKLDWDYYFLAHAYFAQGRFKIEPLVKARLRKNEKVPKNHPK